jgi:undecaprenyl diphosphate synthase
MLSSDALPIETLEEAPRHVAIIMDGNRRWARLRGLPEEAGHAEGVVALKRTVEAAIRFGVETLTVFGFSTENWNRDPEQVEQILWIIGDALMGYRSWMVEQGVALHVIGHQERFDPLLRAKLHEVQEATAGGQNFQLVIALNYGGRDDIVRAAKRMAQVISDPDEVDEELFAKFLDTAAWPDPELLIRTSGEQRLSNFLLWQLSYAEIAVTEILWPDFDANALLQLLLNYQMRDRRHGK